MTARSGLAQAGGTARFDHGIMVELHGQDRQSGKELGRSSRYPVWFDT